MASHDPDLENELRDLLTEGRKIEAVKLYREATGAGLAAAKEAVEALESGETAADGPADSSLEEEIVALLEGDKKIEAVRLYRKRTGTDLKEAKDAVEAIAADRHLATSSRAGCLGAVLLLAAALTLSLASSVVVLAADAARSGNVASGKKATDAAVRCVATEKPGRSPGADRDAAFLFSYFCGNGEDGLHLASSPDGYRWTARNQGRPFLAPQVGGKLMRDPCLIQGPDGVFQLVWTTGWGGPVIGHASSRDLVRWSAQQAIPVMTHEPTARNAWAPELFYDEDQKQFLIFWSTTIPGRFPETDRTGDKGWNHRVYATTTRDFKTFTATKLFYDGGFNVIDATILKARGEYYLIVKDETKTPVKKELRIARSTKAEGPYRDVSAPISIHWVEGPSAIRIGDEFLIYFDHYAAPQYYGAIRSSDLVHWKDVSSEVHFPKGTRHGTALRVSKEFLATLPY